MHIYIIRGKSDRSKSYGVKENFEHILSEYDGYAAERERLVIELVD